MIRKIVFLGHHVKAVTGGHKYNEAFEYYLECLSGLKAENIPSCSRVHNGWRKLIAPLTELRWMCLFKKDTLVFFMDTLYKYHILVAFINKFFFKCKTTVIIHHFPFIGEEGCLAPLNKWLMLKYYSLMDIIIVPSPYTLDVAKSYFPKKNICYVPLPFERKFQLSNNYEPGNLLFVGTIESRKGLKYLLEAMDLYYQETHRKLSLTVIGKIVDSEYKYGLDTFIAQKHLTVNFLGRVSDDVLNSCYKKAEVFAFPSLLEGYGIVLVESMQRGLPIVCFNNTAMPYSIVDGVNGYIAKNKDSFDFAKKLNAIINCSSERFRIQQGMKQTIEHIKTQKDFKEGIRNFWDSVK